MTNRLRPGKGYEHEVCGTLIEEGFDVYIPTVDDQGIDGIIRVKERSKTKYYDFQVKGGKEWNRIRCHISKLHPGMILFLYSYGETGGKKIIWLFNRDVRKHFEITGSDWG